jgi:hypothetical protein
MLPVPPKENSSENTFQKSINSSQKARKLPIGDEQVDLLAGVFPLTLSSAENTFQQSIKSSQKARKLSISDDAQLKKQVDLLVDEYANKEINNFFHFDSFQ